MGAFRLNDFYPESCSCTVIGSLDDIMVVRPVTSSHKYPRLDFLVKGTLRYVAWWILGGSWLGKIGSFRACIYMMAQIPYCSGIYNMTFEVGGVVPCYSDEVWNVVPSILEPCWSDWKFQVVPVIVSGRLAMQWNEKFNWLLMHCVCPHLHWVSIIYEAEILFYIQFESHLGTFMFPCEVKEIPRHLQACSKHTVGASIWLSDPQQKQCAKYVNSCHFFL